MSKNEIISYLNEKIATIKCSECELWLLNPLYAAIDELNEAEKALYYACVELSLNNKLPIKQNMENMRKIAKKALEKV